MFNKTLIIILLLIFSAFNAESQTNPPKCPSPQTKEGAFCVETKTKDLVGTPITIKIYTKTLPGKTIDRTFVVVHDDEQKGLNAIKETLSEPGYYGRLVELISKSANGQASRYLFFDNNNSCIDPNRIYSKSGIKDNLRNNPCSKTNPAEDKDDRIFKFGEELMNTVIDNGRIKFIIGVHNNDDEGDLTVNAFKEGSDCLHGKCKDAKTAVGIFQANDHPKNTVVDVDDFILVSNIKLFGKIAAIGNLFNIVLQENKDFLESHPETDDGSMSIYFGKKDSDYINIEVEGKKNINDPQNHKQKQIEAIKLAARKNFYEN